VKKMCIFVGFDDIVSFLHIFNVTNRDPTLTFVWKSLDLNEEYEFFFPMIYNLGICSVGTLKSKIPFPVYHRTKSHRQKVTVKILHFDKTYRTKCHNIKFGIGAYH
jgi:hypothetical protein